MGITSARSIVKIGLLIIPHDKWKLGKDYLVSLASPAEMGGSRRIPAMSSSFLVLELDQAGGLACCRMAHQSENVNLSESLRL